MRSVIVTTALVFAALAGPADAAPGDLDASFDGDGVAQLEFGVETSALAAARQPDGKLVLAGRGADPRDDFFIARLLPDGQPDLAFGTEGVRLVDFGPGRSDMAEGVALAPDGKIVVAGTTLADGATQRDIAVARLTPDGELDPAFGVEGKRRLSLGGDEAAHGLVIAPSGRPLLVGEQTIAGETDIIVVALNPTGVPDDTFGAGGVRDIEPAGRLDVVGRDIALASDGDIVVAGDAAGLLGSAGTIAARLTPSGALRPGFGDGGIAVVLGPVARRLALDSEDRVLLAGRQGFDFAAFRLTARGELDGGYGFGGVARVPVLAGHPLSRVPELTGLARDASGRAYLAGTVFELGDDRFPVVAALDGSGRLDPAFGGDGVVTLESVGAASAHAALLARERLVLAGSLGIDADADMAAIALSAAPLAGPVPEPVPTPDPLPAPEPPPAEPTGDDLADGVAPRLTELRLRPRRARAATRGPAVSAKPVGPGVQVSFRLSERAQVQLTIRRRARDIGSVTAQGKAGANRLRLTGRLRGRRLRPGRHLLVAVARDRAGNRSTPAEAGFEIAR
jgi:uncharacterized delta-60 repeat protein